MCTLPPIGSAIAEPHVGSAMAEPVDGSGWRCRSRLPFFFFVIFCLRERAENRLNGHFFSVLLMAGEVAINFLK